MRCENNKSQCEKEFIQFCVKVLYIAQKKILRDIFTATQVVNALSQR